MTDTGLPGVLFGLLDTEQDERLISDIHDTLNSMMLALIDDNLALWLRLCKDVLTTSVGESSHSLALYTCSPLQSVSSLTAWRSIRAHHFSR